ncbi:MAG: hypothetical protein CMH57_13605 [Myxococcales bacterium]|nr:hypothetical protein [Myxococcales bacterium]
MSDPAAPTHARVVPPEEAASLPVQRAFGALSGSLLTPDEARQLLAVGDLLKEARAVVQEARDQAEAIRQQAQAEGYEAGLNDATEALLLARAEYDALLKRSEGDLVSLAMELARSLIGHSLELDPKVVVKLTAQTLKLARNHRRIEVRVHPEDAPLLHRHADALRESAGTPTLFILEDPQVPRHGCRIETEAGIIEADLETQLDLLAQHLGVERWAVRGATRDG